VPEFNGDPVKSKAFSDLSIAFNSQLATQLNSLSLNNPELDITAFQTDALFAEVRNNPGAFGFSNTTNRCISAPSCITGDPAAQSTYLFWDGTHPTTAGHAMIGQRFYQAVYEPVPGPLPAAGAAAALAWSRSLRRRVRPHPQKTSRSCAGQCPTD
jgi:phospholipase/lecithinase/hemolysin